MKPSPLSEQRQLWPTTMGVYQWVDAPEVNPLLVRVLGALRATGQAASGQTGPFFASGDDRVATQNQIRGSGRHTGGAYLVLLLGNQHMAPGSAALLCQTG
mgnify:CR=1 FL=1